jgi:peptidyl-prolyl cis-trans isomerase C
MYAGKRIILPLAIAVLCIVLFAVWLQTKAPDDSEQVASVDGAVITKKELEREMRKTRDSYAIQGQFPDDTQLEDLKQEVLERLIETELLWQQSVREGITVADEAVADELAEMKKQFINEAIFNNLMENAKMTMPELLSLIKKDLAITALVKKKIADSITLSADESEEYYRNNTGHFEDKEKIKASHLFISLEADASDADRQKAQASIGSLKVRLDAGEAFELLAKEASDCPSAENGGDLGFIVRGTMDDIFEETAFTMQLHEISPIVKSSSGYHIIKVTDRQQARVIPFDEVKEDIERYLLDRNIHKGVMDYLEELRQKADIRRHL